MKYAHSANGGVRAAAADLPIAIRTDGPARSCTFLEIDGLAPYPTSNGRPTAPRLVNAAEGVDYRLARLSQAVSSRSRPASEIGKVGSASQVSMKLSNAAFTVAARGVVRDRSNSPIQAVTAARP